jgi:galactokinase
MRDFGAVFGGAPEACADAPGRVNLLGEHTDYNGGFVLPTAIPQRTRVSVRRATSDTFSVYSANLDKLSEFTLGSAPAQQYALYPYGCIQVLSECCGGIPPLDIHVASDVPIGVGLSSSAALEVATLRTVRSLLALDIDDVTIAQLAQRAEVEYAGVSCGILDQMASSLLAPGSMLFLDTRSLQRELLPLPADAEILVLDSGLSRSLASSGYNERRAQCEAAARLLGVPQLRDVADGTRLDALPEPLRQRARHVLGENARVIQALAAPCARTFGALMNASHASLRDDYEVSTPELDRLCSLLHEDDRVFGAKLTGAGFGGACVALCRTGAAAAVGEQALFRYNTGGPTGRVLVPAS